MLPFMLRYTTSFVDVTSIKTFNWSIPTPLRWSNNLSVCDHHYLINASLYRWRLASHILKDEGKVICIWHFFFFCFSLNLKARYKHLLSILSDAFVKFTPESLTISHGHDYHIKKLLLAQLAQWEGKVKIGWFFP